MDWLNTFENHQGSPKLTGPPGRPILADDLPAMIRKVQLKRHWKCRVKAISQCPAEEISHTAGIFIWVEQAGGRMASLWQAP